MQHVLGTARPSRAIDGASPLISSHHIPFTFKGRNGETKFATRCRQSRAEGVVGTARLRRPRRLAAQYEARFARLAWPFRPPIKLEKVRASVIFLR